MHACLQYVIVTVKTLDPVTLIPEWIIKIGNIVPSDGSSVISTVREFFFMYNS